MTTAHTRRACCWIGSVLVALALAPAPIYGDQAQPATLGEALRSGTFGLDLNYRLEWVSDDAFDDDGEASTLRTVLRYRSRPFHGVSVYLEAENITDIGLENSHNNKGYGHLWNDVSDRPVVADPELTEFNQAYLELGLIPETTIRAGRQEVLLGNVRYVGNVGWRQNHQSFDAVKLTTTVIPNTTVTYAWVDKVNRIFGDTKNMNSHLLQADLAISEVGTVSLYGFLLDYQEEADAGLSTATFGARFDGGFAIGDSARLLLDLEYARQRDAADNPAEVDADYYRAEAGARVGGWTVTAGREVLGGHPDEGRFTTPLATLHAWNGWADRFLATPANGLVDSYLKVSTAVGPVKLSGIYHIFEADCGDADYGDEIDLVLVYPTPWKQMIGLKAALYEADTHASEVDKVWLWTSWGF